MGITFDFFDLNLGDPVISAKFAGMYASFFAGIRAHGCQVTLSLSQPNEKADVLVLSIWRGAEPRVEQVIVESRVPVILYVPPACEWFNRRRLERWSKKILFAYGVDAATMNFDAYASVGIDYHYLPFASDPKVMRPLPGLAPVYDIVFVGSLTHKVGRHRYIEALLPAVGDRPCLFIGKGWTRYGMPNQLVAWGDFLNVIYNLGRVCINIHFDDEKQGREAGGLNLNNRLFDYALAGCFQVSDNPEAVYLHFSPDEVVAVDSVEEWVDRILYYLAHPEEKEPFREKARQRALREHTWHHRAAEFVDWTSRALNGAQSVADVKIPRRAIVEVARDYGLPGRSTLKRKLRGCLKRSAHFVMTDEQIRDIKLERKYYLKLVRAWRRRRHFSRPEAVWTPSFRERRDSHPRSRYTPYIDNDRSFEEIAELFGLQPKDLMRFVEEADVPEPELRRFGFARAPRLSDAYSDGIFNEMCCFPLYGFVLYMLTRLMKPKLVVEMGIRGGLTSFCTLMGLVRNEREGARGRMVSFDFETYPVVGKYIPRQLHRNWEIVQGDFWQTLPRWLEMTDQQIDMFVSDTDQHEFPHGIPDDMLIAEDHIRRGGFLVNYIYSVHWSLQEDDPFMRRNRPVVGFHDEGSPYKARVWQKR